MISWSNYEAKRVKTMKTIIRIDKKIESLQNLGADLKNKEKEKQKETQWLYLPKFKVEIQCELTHLNEDRKTTLKNLKAGEDVATYEILQYCRNEKLHHCFINFWARLKQNPDKISEQNGYEAGFYAGSDRASLICGWYPSDSVQALGVFIVRKKVKK